MVENTEPLNVQRAHHLRTSPPLFFSPALVKPALGPLANRLLVFDRQRTKTFKEIGPLAIGVVQEIGVTAVVRTPLTGKIQHLRNPLVLPLQSFINFFQTTPVLPTQPQFAHVRSSWKLCTS
jgi:hypothetical protein